MTDKQTEALMYKEKLREIVLNNSRNNGDYIPDYNFDSLVSDAQQIIDEAVKAEKDRCIKQFKEWEQVAVQTNSEAGCSQAMAFAYKLCHEFITKADNE